MKKYLLICFLFLVLVIFGCKSEHQAPPQVKPAYDNPLPPGESALRKITDPYQLPDFTLACFDLEGLLESVANSLEYLSKPSSRQYFPVGEITHQRAVDSLNAFAELLDSGLSGPALNQAIKQKFDVYISVGCDMRGTVLFTGYYTPIFNGSYKPNSSYRYPLYKKPSDLEKSPDGKILGKRLAGGGLIRYPARSVIEDTGMLKGNELIWLEDEFEAYIAHVQGSAKIRLPDGTLQTVGYAANNGHDYRGISKQMISDGVITKKQLSLGAMIKYFKANAHQIKRYTRLNPRFVFFKNESGDPRGSLNVPVIAYRSIATDKSIFPRASLTFISTNLPKALGSQITNELYSGFALDQDTGGAIRAPGRCDVYMGVGDMAGELAGQTYQEGRLYYLFLKQSEIVTQY
jgi:membrane-bound lytic murein transglycosylase A